MGHTVHVVGGGLAGCEAALQLARLGLPVRLFEMRPERRSAAHQTDDLAEIVCSNSLKSQDPATASGLLKAELDFLGCRLLQAAQETALPAGSALAVDRRQFAARVMAMVTSEPAIELVRTEVSRLAPAESESWIVATGPLTSCALQEELARLSGSAALHFFDAIAPTVTLESLDTTLLYRASRYGKGTADYLNAPLSESEYERLWQALQEAERVAVPDFDRADLFSGCLPIEEIAATGQQSLAFGPLRPVGLPMPGTGSIPHAVVQLRQENREGTLFGLVGFQTRLKHGEQKRVFRMIPGLEKAEFVRLGQMHRNFYLDTPRVLNRRFGLLARPAIRFAGQITGVEGYVESIASGLVTAWLLAADLRGIDLPPWPATTMIGSLIHKFLFDRTGGSLTPMNANFGLLPPPPRRQRSRRDRKMAQGRRALRDLEAFLEEGPLRRLLAATPAE